MSMIERRMRSACRYMPAVAGQSSAITLLVVPEREANRKCFRSKSDNSRKAKISSVVRCCMLSGIPQIFFQINILCRKRAQGDSQTPEIARMRQRHDPESKRLAYSAVSIKQRSFRRRSMQSALSRLSFAFLVVSPRRARQLFNHEI